MANSASDARASELEIRKKLIEEGIVDVIISVGPNFFYTVTLPCTLWFLDKGKKNTNRKDKVLFIDARNIFKQIDRAHREFTPEQIEQISKIVRQYRGEEQGYQDIVGLCKVATISEIESQGWSLNPGRYVGVPEEEDDGVPFEEKMQKLEAELKQYFSESEKLEKEILENLKKIKI